MSIIFFPAHFLYLKNNDNHNELKKELLPKILETKETIKDDKPFNACLFETSFDREELNKKIFFESEELKTMIWNNIENAIDIYNKNISYFKINIKQSLLTRVWYNIYNKGSNHFQEYHRHDVNPTIKDNKLYHPTLSGIYILHDNNKVNNTIFKSYVSPFSNTRHNIIDTSNINNISEGTILLFPSSLEHCVKPVLEDRVTIAFNIHSLFLN